MSLTRPPAVRALGITALTPGVGRFNALSSVASLLMMLLIVAGAAAADGDLRLVEAARNRDQQAIRTLLNQHADVDVRSHDGATALLWAAHWNDLETADLLIRAGANVNASNDLRITPLSLACTNGNAALVERLLKAGASPNTAIATGETPMMTCASTGNVDAVRMLMARGGDVNAKEPLQNQTALMWAAAEHHPDVVRALIEPTCGPLRERDSPRCTLRRGRAHWRAPGCCWQRV